MHQARGEIGFVVVVVVVVVSIKCVFGWGEGGGGRRAIGRGELNKNCHTQMTLIKSIAKS